MPLEFVPEAFTTMAEQLARGMGPHPHNTLPPELWQLYQALMVPVPSQPFIHKLEQYI